MVSRMAEKGARDRGNEILYIEGLVPDDLREQIKSEMKADDIKIVSLENAWEALTGDLEAGQKRTLLARDEDIRKIAAQLGMTEDEIETELRKRGDKRIISCEGFNFLHLGALNDLARALMEEDDDSIRSFYGLLMQRDLPPGRIEGLKRMSVLPLILPPISENLIEDIENIRREHAQFITAA
jgi:hypothetical protein